MNNNYIVGIDYSMNAPGVVKLYLDDNLNITDIKYLGFTSVKKLSVKDSNIIHYHTKNSFKNNIEKAMWMRDNIFQFISDDNNLPSYIAIEGYALNAKGKVFDIAESTMCTKLKIYNSNIPMRIYDPNSIKKFATGYGNADKIRMQQEFVKLPLSDRFDISHLPEFKSPTEDIVDAFWAAKLLQTELQLRNGLILLKDLSLKQIEVFNRVTKSNPINILVQPFLKGCDNV